MSDETTTTATEATTEPEAAPQATAIQQIEAVAEAAIEKVQEAAATPPATVETINAAINAFREDVRANVSVLMPTGAHNTLMTLTEALRSKIVALF
jgi:1,4-dihydroxy-2-naphthoyl-CoA synthase